MKKILLTMSPIVLAGALLLGFAESASAQDPFTKLGRGVANALTGWIEIPKNVYAVSREHNPFAGITLGLARGVGMTLVRTGAGFYEIATFPFPLPENYRPVLEPEYVF